MKRRSKRRIEYDAALRVFDLSEGELAPAGLLDDPVRRVRRDFAQGIEHEIALMRERVGQGQPLASADLALIGHDVDVDQPRPPFLPSDAPEIGFDAETRIEQGFW